MMQSEFTERTGYAPSSEEYRVIEDMYLMCEVNKDEFCKIWCKMNPNKVKEAKEEKKKMEAKKKAFNDMIELHAILCAYSTNYGCTSLYRLSIQNQKVAELYDSMSILEVPGMCEAKDIRYNLYCINKYLKAF